MYTNEVYSPSQAGQQVPALLYRFLSLLLILLGAMLAAIRVQELVFEAQSVNQKVVNERTISVDFGQPVDGTGWSTPEGTFTWTVEREASLSLPVIPGWYELILEATALTDEIIQSLDLRVNGISLELVRRNSGALTRFETEIPEHYLFQGRNAVFTFAVDDVVSPQEMGESQDSRLLGVAVYSLRLKPIAAPQTLQSLLLYSVITLSALGAAVLSYLPRFGKEKQVMFTSAILGVACAAAAILVFIPEVAVSQLVYFVCFGVIIAFLVLVWAPSSEAATGGRSLAYHVRQLWQNRVLLIIWVRYNVLSRYSQATLGILWIVIQPLTMSLILALVFSQIVRAVDTGGVPFITFYLAAVIPWTLFNAGLLNGTQSLIGASSIIEQVYFPREILVLVRLGETLVDVSFTFIAMMVINAILGIYPNIHFVFLPFLLLIQICFMLGLMFFASYISMMIRDIPQLILIILQFMFYLTPILYPVEAIPPNLKFIALINPLAALVDAYRSIILYNEAPNFTSLYHTMVLAGVFLYTGYMFFKKNEKRLADFI